MISLKTVDRLALAAMFSFAVTVAFADSTPARLAAPSSHVLRSDQPREIRLGMTAEQVLALIGPPHAKVRFERTKTTAWDYLHIDAWNYDSEFSVILDDNGLVVDKVIVRNGQ